jgi:AcrR family transcriptional regulator
VTESSTQLPSGNPSPRPRGRPSAGAREAILRATLDLLGEYGLALTTTREIAQRAKVSEASIHYHFGGKDGLLEAALLAALGQLHALDRDLSADGPRLSSRDRLFQAAQALRDFYERALPVFASMQADVQLRQALGTRIAAQDLGPHRAVRLIERHLEAAQARGDIAPGADLASRALLLVGACYLQAWQRQVLAPGAPGDAGAFPSLAQAVEATLDLKQAP